MEKTKSIGSLLVEYGKINEAELEEGLRVQKESGKRLGEALIDLDLITRQDIEWILSKQLDIPFIIVDESSIDTELLYAFPKDFLLNNHIVPMFETPEDIAIVTDDPFNKAAFEFIEQHRDRKVNLSAGDSEAIEELLRKMLKQEGATELIAILDDVFERLRGTSFYRLDFIGTSDGFTINAFGFGIRRTMHTAKTFFSSADVIKVLDALNMNYYYEIMDSGESNGYMMPVYIAEGTLNNITYPVVLGSFGLPMPEEAIMAGLKAMGMSNAFSGGKPLKGYPFFYTRSTPEPIHMAVFTMDSAPKNFSGYHVQAHVPVRCTACGGAGCDECSQMGLTFTEISGTYSQGDIINMLKDKH